MFRYELKIKEGSCHNYEMMTYGCTSGPGGTRRDQEGPGGTRRDQEGPGETRRNQEGPAGGTRRDLVMNFLTHR